MKPSIPKGTRDFSPAEMQRRNKIFDAIRKVFLFHGFQQIETPAMENLETLMGKYGEEGDKLIYKIRSNKDLRKKHPKLNDDYPYFIPEKSDKALRYDLTVPFARFVVMHQNEIAFPFRRFQIQPVWRADNPQRGRYREFYQCDADIIGSDSLLNEVELIQMIDEVFSELKLEVTINLNNRKVLYGIAEKLGMKERLIDFSIVIDKLEKIGFDKVVEEVKKEGLPVEMEAAFRNLFQDWNRRDSFDERKIQLREFLKDSEIGLTGLEELQFIFAAKELLMLSYMSTLEFDASLARGLNYYTGAIIEVKANSVQIGSVCGGGRYDDLTGIFGLPDVSGVGISFGVDRIYDVMEELKLFDALQTEQLSTQILFVNFGEKEEIHCLKLVTELRNKGIAAELYPDRDKIKKQMSYADSRKIPFVAFIGEEEMKSGKVKLKDMKTGEEYMKNFEQVAEHIRKK